LEKITRRNFIKNVGVGLGVGAGIAATSPFWWGCSKSDVQEKTKEGTNMRYRKLGKTGMEVSIIGFGAEHIDGKEYDVVKETVDAAMENGINIMDVFMPGHDIRQKLGKAIKGNRDKFIIQGHLGSTDTNQQYDVSRDLPVVKKYWENLLIDLQTDYIDIGMLFFIDDEKNFDAVFNTDFIRYAEDLKKNGTIRAIGAGSHDPVIAKKMVDTGLVEVLMFSLNPAFDMVPADKNIIGYLGEDFDRDIMIKMDEKRMELYLTCEKLDVPITVMKALGGGKLLSRDHTPFAKPLTVAQCIHYALERPAVASVLLGGQNREQVEETIGYLTAKPSELNYTDAIRSMNRDFKGSCVYCNHCLPCPAGIDIAAVMKYLDIATIDESAVNKGVGQHYKELSAHASDCTKCNDCERRCPFAVEVVKNMERAVGIFGY
jgi:predicted aldo/keto reductase-like oxidoreductase